jgi:hypothetical protein
MNFICNTICIQPRYNDNDYIEISNEIKSLVKRQQAYVEKASKNLAQHDLDYLNILNKFMEVLDNNAAIRENLIKLRNELVGFKTKTNLSSTRSRIIDLTIQIIVLSHSATFYCTTNDMFNRRLDLIKKEFDNLKNLFKTNQEPLNDVDKFYLTVLYKLPKLMGIKRGFKKKHDVSNLI